MTKVLQTGAAQPGPKLTTVIPVRIKRSGGRRWMIPAAGGTDGGVEAPKHAMPVLTVLSRAFYWQRLLDAGRVASGSEIARREGLHPTTVNELLRLTLLSPAVVRALLAGRQPRTLSLIWLKNNEVPWSWDDQERLFGRMDGFDSAPVAGVDREPPRASHSFVDRPCIGQPQVEWRKERLGGSEGRGKSPAGQRPGTASPPEPAPVLAIRARKKPGETPGFQNGGGAREDRTPDLVIANDALSQLSYGPT